MKQIKFFAAVVVAALALSSCSSYSFTSRSTKIEQSNITAVGMLVDVRPDFSKRIIAESGKCKTPMQAKEEAKYIAVTSNNCDVIVDPIYKVEKRGRNYRAYLTGFAGYFKNPRTLYEDVNLLKGVSREDIEKYLILKDPSVLELMNPAPNSEIINIYEGGKPACKEAPKQPAAPVAPAAPAQPAKNKKK